MARRITLLALLALSAFLRSSSARAESYRVNVATGAHVKVKAHRPGSLKQHCATRLTLKPPLRFHRGALVIATRRHRVPRHQQLSWVITAGHVMLVGFIRARKPRPPGWSFAHDGVIWGLDTQNGRRLWSRRVISYYAARLDARHALVEGDRQLLLLDVSSGRIVAQTASRGHGLAAVCRNLAGSHYVAMQGELHRLDAHKHRFIWRVRSSMLGAAPARVSMASGSALVVHPWISNKRDRFSLLVYDELSGKLVRRIPIRRMKYGFDFAKVNLTPSKLRGELHVDAMFAID